VTVTIIHGDVREKLAGLPPEIFDCVLTSVPYWGLRSYLPDGHHDKPKEIGLEPTLDDYLDTIVDVCGELWRVLKPSGVFWLNVGDSYTGSWGAQSRGGAPSAKSTLAGNSHIGGGPKIRSLAAAQIAAAPNSNTGTGSVKRTPGLKPKNLMLIPARLAIRLQDEGWYVRSECIWAKLNPLPESCDDRPTSAHEKIFMLTKSRRYFFDAEAVRESVDNELCSARSGGQTGVGWGRLDRLDPNQKDRGRGRIKRRRGVSPHHAKYESSDQSNLDTVGRGAGRNLRNVWPIATHGFSEGHFATMPPAIAEICIKAGCPIGGHVLDPFGGAGTTALVADRLGRDATLIELNQEYIKIARRRIEHDAGLFADVSEGTVP
jgi:DNA modification methylase